MSAIDLIIPPVCYKKFFLEYDFEANCIKVVISKLLGYGIILGAVLVKVPQIIKILKAGSSEGISLMCVVMELIGLTGTLAYSFAKGFPFSSYGEATFMTVQQMIIMFLVLLHNFDSTRAILCSAAYAGALAYLMSPAAPMDVLVLLQASVLILTLTSRFMQASINYSNKSTGQLSPITIFLQFAGAAARILTSIQETGDAMTVVMYVINTITNGILLFQVYHYNRQKSEQANNGSAAAKDVKSD